MKGAVAKNFNTNTAFSGVEITLDRARDFPFVYVCGVSAGQVNLRAERNLHLPVRYAPGRAVERTTYNGYRIVISNAEERRIPALPEYWMGLPNIHRRCKTFQFGVAYFRNDVPELRKIKDGTASESEVWRIQELFRGVIMSRVREGSLEIPRNLPRLSRNMLREKQVRWFPVPGMYGGFAYRMETRDGRLELAAESWCRVADGSGMRHRISQTQAVLEEEGFV